MRKKASDVGRLLHELGFSPQQPQRRAREREEATIERWREEDWPRIQRPQQEARRAGRLLRSLFSSRIHAGSCSAPRWWLVHGLTQPAGELGQPVPLMHLDRDSPGQLAAEDRT